MRACAQGNLSLKSLDCTKRRNCAQRGRFCAFYFAVCGKILTFAALFEKSTVKTGDFEIQYYTLLINNMALKIVVLAKQVPDTRNVGKDAMTAEGTVNRAALPAIFNPEDLNALEQAFA